MRAMLESAFDDMRGVDAFHDVETAWDKVAAEDALEADDELEGDSVWLECNGELLDVGSVKSCAVRKSSCGFETLVFVCPRCNEPHESVLFR